MMTSREDNTFRFQQWNWDLSSTITLTILACIVEVLGSNIDIDTDSMA